MLQIVSQAELNLPVAEYIESALRFPSEKVSLSLTNLVIFYLYVPYENKLVISLSRYEFMIDLPSHLMQDISRITEFAGLTPQC